MKKHFTKSLAVVFAVLGVYFVAFKVLMKVVDVTFIGSPRGAGGLAVHGPRWEGYFGGESEAMNTFFAPLIWLERKVRGPDRWEWDGTGPEPDWVKENRSKP